MANQDFDVIVIGGGPAGENAAERAARSGLKVAIVERELLGGECSYWACMPSKALLRPGEVLNVARRTPGAAAAVTGQIDVAAALERRNALAANWDDAGQVKWAEGAGLTVIRGHARLDGARRLTVTGSDGSLETYEVSEAVIIATGTGAVHPPITGLAEVAPWDNRDITAAKEIPQRLIILGGGVVGVEMAQAMAMLGSEEVTIIEMMDHLLPHEEPFVGVELAASFERMGIRSLTGVRMTGTRRDGDGPVIAELDGGATVEGDEILVAVGRHPHTQNVGLETVGLTPGEYIEVDDSMRAVGVDGQWLYAVGDVNGRALLTHTGKYQARVAGDHIAGAVVHTEAYGDRIAIPRVVFTDPNVAAVGATEAQARAKGLNIATARYDIGHTAAAAARGRGYRGTCQLVIDDDRRVIVGATFIGPEAGELLHAATIAIVGEVTLDTLWHAIPAFPTLSEVWLRLLEAYGM
jgi:dihydrolipoamide dehydrogenase